MGHNHFVFHTIKSRSIMLTQVSILATLVLSASCLSVEKTKAASSFTNCGCQCSSLTFRDTTNTVQGNCKTVDGTGAQWCYVDSSSSSCQDLVPSERFPHNPWSYQACATPALGSHLCPVYTPVVAVADHVHTSLVVPVVHEDVHDNIPLIVSVSAPASHIHPDERLQTPASKSTGLEAPEK